MQSKILIFLPALFLFTLLSAQTNPDTKGQKIKLELKSEDVEKSDKEDDRLPIFDQYQIFLTEPTKRIEGIEYEKTGKQVDYIFDKSNNRIILENYDGRGRIKIAYENPSGESKSFSKSHCYIDPMQEL